MWTAKRVEQALFQWGKWRRSIILQWLNVDVVDFSVKAMGILIIPYVLFALNMITDSIFYGVGKTQYQAYQAIITNGTVYVVAFLAYITGLWIPTFNSILIVFGIGILVDSILTVFFAFRVLFPSMTMQEIAVT